MVKTPNYKQDKRRREDAQKKRNAEEQARQQERKKGRPDPGSNDAGRRLGSVAHDGDAAEHVIAATRHWLERAVIGLRLCPFAAVPFAREQIRYCVSEQRYDGRLWRGSWQRSSSICTRRIRSSARRLC